MQTLPNGPNLFLCGAFPSAQFPMWTQALARNDSMHKDVGLILVQTGKKTATRTDLLQCTIK